MDSTSIAARELPNTAKGAVPMTGAHLPPGVSLVELQNMKWVGKPTGNDSAYLHGHPSQPGPYLYLARWKPHNKVLAHKHPDDRYGIVISGVHYIGYGDKFDATKLHAHPAGTFFTEPANVGHFGITKDEGAILYFYGVGPSGITKLEPVE